MNVENFNYSYNGKRRKEMKIPVFIIFNGMLQWSVNSYFNVNILWLLEQKIGYVQIKDKKK